MILKSKEFYYDTIFDDARWIPLVKGEKEPAFVNLSTKLLFARLKLKLRFDQTPESLKRCVQDAHDYFRENEKLFQDEIQRIFE